MNTDESKLDDFDFGPQEPNENRERARAIHPEMTLEQWWATPKHLR